jgi:anaerobic magnesium-protoporphyrin IX monomethyl ester cyclase
VAAPEGRDEVTTAAQIVLFNPAPRSGWQVQRRIELPLGLLSVASPLDRAGWRVRIVEEYGNQHWRDDLLQALSDECLCFGVTSMTGPQILHAVRACRLVRERWPRLPIVWGGIHGSLLPEETLRSGWADVVVVGEGEETLPHLVATLANGGALAEVAGIAYLEGGNFRRNAPRPYVDLNRQAPLSYHLVNMDHYRRRLFGMDHVSFNSSRGCTFRCSFCWDPVLHGRRWRAMDPDTVLEQLKRVIRDYGIRGFLFTDDHFFIDLDRARGILEGIVRSNLGISISKLQIRADTICKMDEDFLKLLVRARVRRFTVGVESGNQQLLDAMHKEITLDQVIEANRRLLPHPIVPVYLFMMGLPGETPAQFAESVALAVRLTDENPHAVKTFNIYTPFPGTEMYQAALRAGLAPPSRLEDWAGFNWRNIPPHAPWVHPETRRLAEGLDFPLMFLGKGHFVTPYKKTNPVAVALSRLYYPLARYRVKHLDVRFPVETKVVKALGLFGRQD